jgi:hypothetical protein
MPFKETSKTILKLSPTIHAVTWYYTHVYVVKTHVGIIGLIGALPCKQPFTYAICHNELGQDLVHQYIGQEPSGRSVHSSDHFRQVSTLRLPQAGQLTH